MNKKVWFGLGGLLAMALLIFLIGIGVKSSFGRPSEFPVHTSMPQLRATKHPLLIRTDFSDDAAWQRILAATAQEVVIGHGPITTHANLEVVADPLHADTHPEQLAELAGDYKEAHGFMILADAKSMNSPEHLLLLVDLDAVPLRTFRAPPANIPLIENNLSLANMSFDEFANHTDVDGVFRDDLHEKPAISQH